MVATTTSTWSFMLVFVRGTELSRSNHRSRDSCFRRFRVECGSSSSPRESRQKDSLWLCALVVCDWASSESLRTSDSCGWPTFPCSFTSAKQRCSAGNFGSFEEFVGTLTWCANGVGGTLVSIGWCSSVGLPVGSIPGSALGTDEERRSRRVSLRFPKCGSHNGLPLVYGKTTCDFVFVSPRGEEALSSVSTMEETRKGAVGLSRIDKGRRTLSVLRRSTKWKCARIRQSSCSERPRLKCCAKRCEPSGSGPDDSIWYRCTIGSSAIRTPR